MFYLLFLLFSLGQVGRIELFNQQINFYIYEVFLFGLLAWYFIRYRFRPIEKSWGKFKAIYFFFAVAVISYIVSILSFNLFQNIVALHYLLRLLSYFLLFFYLNYYLERKKIEIDKLKNGLTLFIVLTAIFATLQYFLYPNLRNLYYLGWDPHLFRVFGTFFDTSIAAAVFGLVILYSLLNKQWIILGIYSIMGLLTYSRGFYISILATTFFYLIQKKLWKVTVAVIAVFTLALFVIPKPFGEGVNLQRVFTIEARLVDDQKAISIWQKNPILGIGYNRIGAVKGDNPVSHTRASFPSSFLIILATTGMVGIVAFIMMLKNLASISNPSKIYILFLSVFSLFDNILLHPFTLFLLLSLLVTEQVI